jgi:hypothetical protein
MFLACVSCSKKKPAGETGSAGSAATAEGSGSAAMAGSAMMAGSGSAMEGSAEGSGSAAMAGSGSAAMAGSGSAAEAAEAGEGSGWFDKLSHDDKVKFMKEKVVPEMKVTFQKFDAKKYKNFGCKTCHGKHAKQNKFKMPNADIPKLDFAALKAGKQKPKVAEWMGKVVKPEMAKLLQMPEYTEQNPKGFGCLDCHEQKK